MTDSSLNQFVTRGTAAARAAFTPTPPLSSSGYFWFETDTSDTYSWSGSAWVKVNSSSGGGALTLIASVTTSSSATDITFSSIPATHKHLRIVLNARGTTAAVATQMKIQLNGDTAANYDYQYVLGIGGAASASAAYAAAFGIVGDCVAATGTANSPSLFDILLGAYAGTTFHKEVIVTMGARWGTSGGAQEAGVLTTAWHGTAAVNAVKLFPTAGAFVDGSTADLYGF